MAEIIPRPKMNPGNTVIEWKDKGEKGNRKQDAEVKRKKALNRFGFRF